MEFRDFSPAHSEELTASSARDFRMGLIDKRPQAGFCYPPSGLLLTDSQSKTFRRSIT